MYQRAEREAKNIEQKYSRIKNKYNLNYKTVAAAYEEYEELKDYILEDKSFNFDENLLINDKCQEILNDLDI